MLAEDENKLARIQPSAPVLAAGAGRSFTGASRG